MKRIRNKTSAGFGAIELLLMIVLIGLVAFIGYEVYKSYHKVSASYNNASSGNNQTANQLTSSNPYAGWRSATLKYEKLSFMFPGSWALTNNSIDGSTTDANICVHPGIDNATLALPNGELMFLDTGVVCGAGVTTQVSSMPIDVLGSTHYISFVNNDTSSSNKNPTEACLSMSASSLVGLPSRNIFINKALTGTPSNFICFSNAAAGSSAHVHRSVAQMETDPNYVNAVLVFKSLKY